MKRMKDVMDKVCESDYEKRLFKAVVRKIGGWKYIWNSPQDYCDASNGVPGFTYYEDTKRFAKRHIEDILSCLADYQREVGAVEIDADKPLNWLAWFALEYIANKINDYKEGYYD